jgi:D-3-phosphoglycerate dehydrogenase / 2-oxoglutarate reductase
LDKPVNDPVDALLLDLVAWVAGGERSYAETMEAWRTSCPRLPVWEEANARGLVTREHVQGRGAFVRVTTTGRELLKQHRAMR